MRVPVSNLVHLTAARQAIAKAKTVDEVADIRDKAEAVRSYAKARGMSLEIQNDAAEIKLRCERRAGEILAAMEKNDGGRPTKTSSSARQVSPRLEDIGVTRSDSSRWQTVASVPEPDFERHIAETRGKGQELTTAGILREARKDEIAGRKLDPPPTPDGKHRVIYADPPWSYTNSGFSQSAISQYATMPTDKIVDLPVSNLSADDAALFLWVTSPLLPDGLRVLSAWGFTYKASIVWEKDRAPGLGWWVNTKHEMVLIGARGDIGTPRERPDSVFRHPVGKHSEKPEIVRTMIEVMFSGPYLELFARRKADGWVSWGDEIRD